MFAVEEDAAKLPLQGSAVFSPPPPATEDDKQNVPINTSHPFDVFLACLPACLFVAYAREGQGVLVQNPGGNLGMLGSFFFHLGPLLNPSHLDLLLLSSLSSFSFFFLISCFACCQVFPLSCPAARIHLHRLDSSVRAPSNHRLFASPLNLNRTYCIHTCITDPDSEETKKATFTRGPRRKTP